MILGIDTATPQVGVAIASSQGVLASFHASGDRRHAETLVPAIEFTCAQAQVSLSQLSAIAVDVGPGLYTGLRVGIATAKAISYACDIKLLGVTSLEVLAYAVRFSQRRILATIDARRSEIFYACYEAQLSGPGLSGTGLSGTGLSDTAPTDLVCLQEPQVATPEAVVSQLGATEHPSGLLAVGDGALRYREIFAAVPGLEIAASSTAAQTKYPSAAALAELAYARLSQTELEPADPAAAFADPAAAFADPAAAFAEIAPLYLRAPDAQINWEQRERVSGK